MYSHTFTQKKQNKLIKINSSKRTQKMITYLKVLQELYIFFYLFKEIIQCGTFCPSTLDMVSSFSKFGFMEKKMEIFQGKKN